MIRLIRTDSDHPGFRQLVSLLDEELKLTDGDQHVFYAQYNKIDHIRHVVVAFADDLVVGCGAIKPYSENTAEVKRMYVRPEFRRQKIAEKVLEELEAWARELGFTNTILETGKLQTGAVKLYQKSGYAVIPNYGQYEGVELSICFTKPIGINP